MESPRQSRATRVAVILGGRSSEHAISCLSATSVLRALDRQRYDVTAIGIGRDGTWVEMADDPDRWACADGALPEVAEVAIDPVTATERAVGLVAGMDVVFPILHGPWGEDGTVQGMLETIGVPYVGSGVLASAVAMDKGVMKSLLAAAGLPVGPWCVITDRDWCQDQPGALDRVAALGLPVFVKPARAGSSVGISRVVDADALVAAIDEARTWDPRVIVERQLAPAREIECGVLTDDSGRPFASACAEIKIRAGHDFYDFEAKYLDDSADLIVPADLAGDVADEVRRLSTLAFDALGCEGLARVDFFVTAQGILVNEVNTMPGFTPISMFPRMWAVSGLDYPALVDHLIGDALRRGTGLR